MLEISRQKRLPRSGWGDLTNTPLLGHPEGPRLRPPGTCARVGFTAEEQTSKQTNETLLLWNLGGAAVMHPTLGFGSGHDPRVKGSIPASGSAPGLEFAWAPLSAPLSTLPRIDK